MPRSHRAMGAVQKPWSYSFFDSTPAFLCRMVRENCRPVQSRALARRRRMGPFPIEFARLLGHGAGLQVAILDAGHRHDLGMVARREDLVCLEEIPDAERP